MPSRLFSFGPEDTVVAEAIPEQEEVTTPASTPEAPESIPEPTTPVEEEGGVDLDAILSGLDAEPAKVEATGSTAPSDGKVDNPLEGLTPEQIEERGAQRERDRIQRESNTTERQRRIDGLNNALPTIKGRVKDTLTESGLPTETVLSVLGMFDELHGTHIGLRQYDAEQIRPGIVQEAGAEMQRQVATLIYDALKEDLGEPALKAVQGSDVKSWADLTKAITKEARKGYVPAADYTKKSSVKELLKRIDTVAREHGLSLDAFTGNGGTDLPPPRSGVSAGSGPRSLAAYNGATMQQRAAWDKADPGLLERLVAEAQRRGG